MDQFKRVLHPPLCLAQERASLLLASEARVVKLIHLVDGRKSLDHILMRHPPQHRHVDVPQSSMPMPYALLAMLCQAHQLCHTNSEQVQPVPHMLNSSPQLPTWLTSTHHPLLDADVVSHLVELADAYDVRHQP
jgi:hypothetical protein